MVLGRQACWPQCWGRQGCSHPLPREPLFLVSSVALTGEEHNKGNLPVTRGLAGGEGGRLPRAPPSPADPGTRAAPPTGPGARERAWEGGEGVGAVEIGGCCPRGSQADPQAHCTEVRAARGQDLGAAPVAGLKSWSRRLSAARGPRRAGAEGTGPGARGLPRRLPAAGPVALPAAGTRECPGECPGVPRGFS